MVIVDRDARNLWLTIKCLLFTALHGIANEYLIANRIPYRRLFYKSYHLVNFESNEEDLKNKCPSRGSFQCH